MSRILLITDAHAHVGDQDLARFSRLADLCNWVEPDALYDLGDTNNWDSVKDHPKLPEECEVLAYQEIQVNSIIEDHLSYAKVKEKRRFFGNHEWRWDRLRARYPQRFLDINFDVYKASVDAGWITHPYREIHSIDNCLFSHAVISGGGRPMGGKHCAANQALLLGPGQFMFTGHLHTYQVSVVPSVNGSETKGAILCPAFHDAGATDEPYAIGMPNRNVGGAMIIETNTKGKMPWMEFVPFHEI